MSNNKLQCVYVLTNQLRSLEPFKIIEAFRLKIAQLKPYSLKKLALIKASFLILLLTSSKTYDRVLTEHT
ncbi:hypothetical protein [Nostoc sp.]|uniref:hypothetical protein n=1 Tax=Nostoc sp. TaxID=1180 RepID=UPI002FF8957C